MKLFYDDDNYVNLVDRRKIKKLKRKYYCICDSEIFYKIFKLNFTAVLHVRRIKYYRTSCIDLIFDKPMNFSIYMKLGKIFVRYRHAYPYRYRIFPSNTTECILVFNTETEMLTFKLQHM